MSENQSLQDYINKQSSGQLHNGPVIGCDPAPFMRPPGELTDQHRGGFNPAPFGVQQIRMATDEERISLAFKALAQLVAALPESDRLNGAKRCLVSAGEYVAQHFIDQTVYPNGKPAK